MNAKNFLIETIFTLDPVKDIYKAIGFAKIIFSKKEDGTDYTPQISLICQLESDVYKSIPLKIANELYYTYGSSSLNNIINHKLKSGKIIRIPIADLRDSMRKLYFGIIEIIYISGIMSGEFNIGDSGNVEYGEEPHA